MTENDDDDDDDDEEEEDDGIRYSLPTPYSSQVEPTTSGVIEIRRRNPICSSQIKTQQKLNRMSWLKIFFLLFFFKQTMFNEGLS